MKIVKTVGQAFEMCHKLSLQKTPQLDNGDDCSETPCDTSEQDRFSEIISQGDEDEFENIPRKGEFIDSQRSISVQLIQSWLALIKSTEIGKQENLID